MAATRFETLHGFVLHARPFGEQQSLITLLTKEHSKVRCLMRGQPPELARQFEVKVKVTDGWFHANSFRYLDPVLVQSPMARYFLLYLNELTYFLGVSDVVDTQFYGQYMASLIHLNDPSTLQYALRFFELALMDSLGQGIDFTRTAEGVRIQPSKQYCFVAGQGFVDSVEPAMSGDTVLAAGLLDKSKSGALALARTCAKAQLDLLLDGRVLNSRQWPLPEKR